MNILSDCRWVDRSRCIWINPLWQHLDIHRMSYHSTDPAGVPLCVDSTSSLPRLSTPRYTHSQTTPGMSPLSTAPPLHAMAPTHRSYDALSCPALAWCRLGGYAASPGPGKLGRPRVMERPDSAGLPLRSNLCGGN